MEICPAAMLVNSLGTNSGETFLYPYHRPKYQSSPTLASLNSMIAKKNSKSEKEGTHTFLISH